MPDCIRTNRAHPPRRRLLAAAAALAGALGAATAIAACGSSTSNSSSSPSSSKSPPSPASNPTGSTLAFSKCMRANGVPNFPDLSSNGMLIAANGQTISVNGVSVNAPAFVAARQKCEMYMPHVHASQAQTAQQRQRDLQFAQCMRSHGVPNWPDPRVITGTGGNHVADLRGVNFQAPAVQSAAKACGGFNPKGP